MSSSIKNPINPEAGPAFTANSEADPVEVKKAELRWSFEQAHASARIEGHIPDPQYLADCEAVIAGTMTMAELRAASLARAKSAYLAASVADNTDGGNDGA